MPQEDELRAEEQNLMTMYAGSDLDQIQDVRTKIDQVSSMMTFFATKVTEQQEMIENIHEDAVKATDYIQEGEKHLIKAKENRDSYRFYVVCWFIGSAFFLLA